MPPHALCPTGITRGRNLGGTPCSTGLWAPPKGLCLKFVGFQGLCP